MYYKIFSSLVYEGPDYKIDFIGSDAIVTGGTPNYIFVKFFTGHSFMIDRKRFLKAAKEQRKPEETMLEVHDVSLSKDGVEIKLFRTLLDPNDENYTSVKRNAHTWFKFIYKTHYDQINTKLVDDTPFMGDILPQLQDINKEPEQESLIEKSNTEMAKTTATETPAETGVVLFEQKVEQVALPEIPKNMKIGNIEFSEEEIKKKVAEAKELKVEIPLDTDTHEVAKAKMAVYEKLDEMRKQFVKTRTAPETFRKNVTKPLTDWSKKLKTQTDAYGVEAKLGEDYCAQQIAIYDNWKEEQERIAREALDKLVSERSADLQDLEGLMNRDSLHWTFKHDPAVLIENEFIEKADKEEWAAAVAKLKTSFQTEKDRLAKQQEEFEASKNAVYNTRIQMLQMAGGYTEAGEAFTKNGHTLTKEAIRNTPEAEWFPLVMSHNEVKKAANPFESPATQQAPTQTSNPFGGAPASQPQTQPQTGGFSNPFGQPAPTQQPVEEDPQGTENAEPEPLFWDDQISAKSVARLLRTENRESATEGIGAIKHEAKFDNGFTVIIF